MRRDAAAHALENTFLEHGFDIQCSTSKEDPNTLLVWGPSGNRVLAHNFIRTLNMQKTLQDAGFAEATFFNESSGVNEKYPIAQR
jgi:hypothetical protein